MGCFSFQASKNLTCGEGGIILTNDEPLADGCRSVHDCGRRKGGAWYEHDTVGGNYRMSEFLAALLLCQLQRLDGQTRTRDANGRYLDEQLGQIPGIQPMARGVGETRHAYHLYMFRYSAAEFGGVPRARLLEALKAEGVPASPGYLFPLYRQPLFMEKRFGPYTGYRHAARQPDYAAVSCPVCERVCAGEGCWLTQNLLLGTREDMDDIVRAVRKVYENRGELRA